MVRAYDYYASTYDPDCGVSLSRMLKDVFSAMRQGRETHLSHCAKCGVVHLSHEEKAGIIECPVCILARWVAFRPAANARREGRDTGVAGLPRLERGGVACRRVPAPAPGHRGVERGTPPRRVADGERQFLSRRYVGDAALRAGAGVESSPPSSRSILGKAVRRYHRRDRLATTFAGARSAPTGSQGAVTIIGLPKLDDKDGKASDGKPFAGRIDQRELDGTEVTDPPMLELRGRFEAHIGKHADSCGIEVFATWLQAPHKAPHNPKSLSDSICGPAPTISPRC